MMESKPFLIFESQSGPKDEVIVSDSLRVPKAPADATANWQDEKRRNTLNLLIKCCNIWQEADSSGLLAVREKISSAIMHTHDAFVQLKRPPHALQNTEDTAADGDCR
jgi:hypothetical protein